MINRILEELMEMAANTEKMTDEQLSNFLTDLEEVFAKHNVARLYIKDDGHVGYDMKGSTIGFGGEKFQVIKFPKDLDISFMKK